MPVQKPCGVIRSKLRMPCGILACTLIHGTDLNAPGFCCEFSCACAFRSSCAKVRVPGSILVCTCTDLNATGYRIYSEVHEPTGLSVCKCSRQAVILRAPCVHLDRPVRARLHCVFSSVRTLWSSCVPICVPCIVRDYGCTRSGAGKMRHQKNELHVTLAFDVCEHRHL